MSAEADDPSGCGELCRQVVEHESGEFGALGPEKRLATPGGLARLVAAAFKASLDPYEGAHPRFTIAVRGGPFAIDGYIVVRFNPFVDVDAQTLRDLARVAPGYPLALSVHDGGGELRCDGVVDLHRNHVEYPSHFHIAASDLSLHVLGPGDLVLDCGAGTGWRLRAGRVRRIELFAYVTPMHQLAESACRDALAREASELDVKNVGGFLRDIWAAVVQALVDSGCGGMFAVVPRSDPHLFANVRGARLARSLTELALDWHDAWRRDNDDEPKTMDRGGRDPYAKVRQLARRTARTLAGLAALDGCVVFDSRIQLVGYGAKVVASGHVETCDEYDVRGERVGEFRLSTRGTRHRAAATLAASVPSAVVVVVSQDGAVRVFSSSTQGVVAVTRECRAWSQMLGLD